MNYPEPVNPTTVIASVSGGKDSTAMLISLAEKYLASGSVKLLAHHQVIPEDWEGTTEYNQEVCQRLGVPLVVEQAKYFGYHCRHCGGKYLSASDEKGQGKCPVVLERLPNGKQRRCGTIAQGELITIVAGLLDLMKWRKAWPSKSIRFCTSYLKRDLFNKFARREKANWGECPVIAMGERWAESPNRAKLPHIEQRSGLEWLTEWHPILSYRRIDAFQTLRYAGIEPHPCYKLQGMTDYQMYEIDEEGGPRMSCACCFFNSPEQLAVNAGLNKELFERVLTFEAETGHTVKDGLSMAAILAGERSVPAGKRKKAGQLELFACAS